METIWKFPLEVKDKQIVRMPDGSEILSAQAQHGTICIWAKVDSDAPLSDLTIYVRGTGHPILSSAAKYLDTVQLHDGALIFHVFWENR